MKKLILIISLITLCFTMQAQQVKPIVINSAGGSMQYGGGYLAYSLGETIIGTQNGSTTTLTQGFLQTWKTLSKTVIFKVFLEGLYSGGGTMRQAQDLYGSRFAAGISDSISVELHNITPPYGLVYNMNGHLLTDGTITVNSVPEGISGSYYAVIKHRNSVETWSSAAIDFSSGGPFHYDFTTAASKAYGNNQKLMPGNVYAIYSGDATQDGVVDGSDLASIDNASTAVLKGYNSEDINGDGIVDGSDMAVIDNNSTAVVHKLRP